jgi:LysM repeat protein
MSACVVLAWCILTILAAAGPAGPARAQATHRIAISTTPVTLTTFTTAAMAAGRKPVPASSGQSPRYAVRPGDTLSGIAAALGVRGGWPALYTANRHAIGPNPNDMQPGTILVLPGQAQPARYTVAPGDTLSGIAAALGVRGGWPALYAANRRAIGPDPNRLWPGAVLTVPPPAARPASQAPPARPAHPARPAPSPAGHQRPGEGGGKPTAPAVAPVASGMPWWLTAMLIAVGVAIGAALIAEPAMVTGRRRWRAARRRRVTRKANLILADHDRLIVMYSQQDDTVYVLTPPGEDPRAVLRAARLVVPEERYGQLADHLGVPASWPLE